MVVQDLADDRAGPGGIVLLRLNEDVGEAGSELRLRLLAADARHDLELRDRRPVGDRGGAAEVEDHAGADRVDVRGVGVDDAVRRVQEVDEHVNVECIVLGRRVGQLDAVAHLPLERKTRCEKPFFCTRSRGRRRRADDGEAAGDLAGVAAGDGRRCGRRASPSRDLPPPARLAGAGRDRRQGLQRPVGVADARRQRTPVGRTTTESEAGWPWKVRWGTKPKRRLLPASSDAAAEAVRQRPARTTRMMRRARTEDLPGRKSKLGPCRPDRIFGILRQPGIPQKSDLSCVTSDTRKRARRAGLASALLRRLALAAAELEPAARALPGAVAPLHRGAAAQAPLDCRLGCGLRAHSPSVETAPDRGRGETQRAPAWGARKRLS